MTRADADTLTRHLAAVEQARERAREAARAVMDRLLGDAMAKARQS